jgi:tetratricopeptide (TPR) repeat protein
LDNLCHFSSLDFIGLIDKVLEARANDSLARQKLRMYKAHYLHREKKYILAVRQLDRAFDEYASNPVPLFLASEWLLDVGNMGVAKKYYHSALEVAKQSGKNYSELIKQVGSRFQNGVN